MAEKAEVSSTEVIEEFRSALLVYMSKVRPLLDDSADEVFRTREWLRVEQRIHWEKTVQSCNRRLADAQQALFSAQLAHLREPSSAEVMEVQRARRALAAAVEKLRVVKGLGVTFEKDTHPRLKQVEQLRVLIANELPKAVHFLDRILGTLESYQAVQPSGDAGGAA